MNERYRPINWSYSPTYPTKNPEGYDYKEPTRTLPTSSYPRTNYRGARTRWEDDWSSEGWRELPDMPYEELPWFSYLSGGRQDLPYWRGPSKMPMPSMQMWNTLSPSEQSMYQGMLETQGVYSPDFFRQMQRLSPQWNMPSKVRWV